MTVHTVPRHVLEGLAHLSPLPPREPRDASGLVASIVAAGSADEHEVEALLRDLDPRRLPNSRTMAEWPPLFGIPYIPMAFRPGPKRTSAMLFERLPAAHLAAFLIQLERLGLPIDPSPLVEALLPGIEAKPFVDAHELTLAWYARTRHRGTGDILRADGDIEGEASSSRYRQVNGYEVGVTRRGEAVVAVSVLQPRRMRASAIVETHCPDCLQTYHRGDYDSVENHRREHARMRPAFAPKPSARLRALPPGPERGLVHWNSPAWMARAVHKRALLFRRDQGYDFVQWAEDGEDDPDVVGYLVEDDSGTFPDGTIVGATCFRKRRGRWEMDWIWLCPKARRKGILARRWPWFRERFGNFGLAYPLSEAMRAFVEVHDPKAETV